MHKAIRFMHDLSPWLILCWAIAAGVTVAATLYVTGGDSLFGAGLDIDILGAPAEDTARSLLDRAISTLGGLGFSLACGGLVLVNMVLAHGLLTRLQTNANEFVTKRAKAKAATEHIKAIRSGGEAMNALLAARDVELARLGARDSFETVLTNEIVATIARELEPQEARLTEHALRTSAGSSRINGTLDALNTEELRRRVSAVRKTFDDIYPHVCGERTENTTDQAKGASHETVH